MDRVLTDFQPGLGTTAITGELVLTKTGTTARTVTFPDAAISVARTDAAQTFTGLQSFATLTATGQITSTLATGTAPLVIASTTVVGNLNVSQLLGATWAAPGAIGGTTPAAISCTTLTTTGGAVISGGAFAQGSIYSSATLGQVFCARTGSAMDLAVFAPDANYLFYVLTGTKTVTFAGSVSCTALTVASADYIYLRGNATTDGSVRMSSQAAETMTIERRTGGSWVVMGSFA